MTLSTYEQALSSNSADFLKQVRSSYKGKVTRNINALKSALVYVGTDQLYLILQTLIMKK